MPGTALSAPGNARAVPGTSWVRLADLINPCSVGPALYLITARRRVVRVMQFTVAVFLVELVARILLTILQERCPRARSPAAGRSSSRHARSRDRMPSP